MAFDQETRNLLQRTVTACRRMLDREFTAQLQELYGIQPDGSLTPSAELEHLGDEELEVARLLRERINHLQGGSASEALTRTKAQPEHVARVIREQAFTVLNRLAALRLCEERGLVLECVRQGVNSEGFQLFMSSAGNALGETHEAYRVYLSCLFDELALDLGVLFDRFSPLALLFPRHHALTDVLKELNGSGKAAEREETPPEQFAHIWQADETIGWIYQYYNDEAERKKMREESAAPRNSRELAVRNQFFTPRYVVEFLTDNTLGRIWYEMTQGATMLREQCRYLVRRPTEIFLREGDTAPDQSTQDDLSQEDLLKQPVYIPHRPLKDPRTILMLDPACGSMHFGLYAFDLFEVIYDEAWALEETLGANALRRPPGMKSLHDTYADKDSFLKNVPRLIIEHNLHGIDIDPRCVQIAGLSLWLRAQKAWQRLDLSPAKRRAIKRSNIVCAEPMPGEKGLLRDFVEREFPANERDVCLRLLEAIFDKMQLAGEVGSLLKIEKEIRSAIEEARHQATTPRLFDADVGSLTSEDFWNRIEERIYIALHAYAEQAEHGGGFQRRLFAENAARGFAFIDVCRKRYDVVLMNPPFGAAAVSTRSYIAGEYSESKDDIYAAFVARMSNFLADGLLGVLSNRTGFFLTSMRRWREAFLLDEPSLRLMADLGDGVLDGALVEAAAYIISPHLEATSTFFRLLDKEDKGQSLRGYIASIATGGPVRGCFIQATNSFHDFPEARISYWASESIRAVFRDFGCASQSGLTVQFGLSTKDDWRFLRLCWEVPPSQIADSPDCCEPRQRWMYLAKGGEYAMHFGDIHLVANWANRGREIGERAIQLYPYLNGDPNWVLHSEVPYGKPGVTYTNRTTSGFSPRVLPSGCLISSMGCTIYASDDSHLPRVLTTYASRAFGYLLEFNVAAGDSVHSGSAARHYEIGTVAAVPIPKITELNAQAGGDAIAIWKRKAAIDARGETSRFFLWPFANIERAALRACAVKIRACDLERFVDILSEASHAEDSIRRLYTFDGAALEASDAEFGPDVTKYPNDLEEASKPLLAQLWSAGMSEVVASAADALGFARFISKMTFLTDRRFELLCHRFRTGPQAVADAILNLPATDDESAELTVAALEYAVGSAFGRWDIRYATCDQAAPELPDPFAPLSACPPGQLQNAEGLPARPEDVPAAYPVRISWDGILVDDPNHPLDIERRVREVIDVIWGGVATPSKGGLSSAEAIEHEACEILGVKSLRDYFRKPAGFFADHLKRYSKSRRQAPIYWPLSTASGSYTLWIYYHRLTPDTLYKCVQLVDLKLADVEKELTHLRTVLYANEGGAKERTRLEDLEDVRRELIELRTELELWAPKWKPNLNDGVIITAAPLWKLFRLPKWQKDLKACWLELEQGDYDWAHQAYTLWPDRIREQCRSDRSIAIAHGLEGLCEVEEPEENVKKVRRKKRRNAPAADLEI